MSDTPVTAPAAPVQSEAQTEATEAPEGKQTPPKKKAPTIRTFKVGDEEVNLSDEDIARDYKKWKGADAKFREAADMTKSVQNFMKALEENPEEVLSNPNLPINKKKLAEKWLIAQIESELNPADPRDQKLTEAERKLKEYQDKEAAENQTKEQQELAQRVEQRKTSLSKTLSDAMQATDLSKHPESAAATLREMALYMRAAKERGEDVTPQELVEHIHNNRFNQFYTLANQLEGEDLIEFLGEEVVKRMRKADLARIKAARGEQGESHRSEETWTPRRSERSKPMDAYEARRHADKILLGKK